MPSKAWICLQIEFLPASIIGNHSHAQYPRQAVFGKLVRCMHQGGLILEGAGADPSQRTGTRFGGVVSSRDCRLFRSPGTRNTVDPVARERKMPHSPAALPSTNSTLRKVLMGFTASAG